MGPNESLKVFMRSKTSNGSLWVLIGPYPSF